jgi:hypothetical protein
MYFLIGCNWTNQRSVFYFKHIDDFDTVTDRKLNYINELIHKIYASNPDDLKSQVDKIQMELILLRQGIMSHIRSIHNKPQPSYFIDAETSNEISFVIRLLKMMI